MSKQRGAVRAHSTLYKGTKQVDNFTFYSQSRRNGPCGNKIVAPGSGILHTQFSEPGTESCGMVVFQLICVFKCVTNCHLRATFEGCIIQVVIW